jgi:hypothetical protein
MGAAAAGAATLVALGAASPAMAYSQAPSHEFNQNDFGGVNVLSNFCVNVNDVNVIQLVDLLTSGSAYCEFDDSNVWVNGKGHKK